MKRLPIVRSICAALILAFIALPAIDVRAETARTNRVSSIETDVCVYGGTSAGIAAAIQVARSGKRCVLVTPKERIGGLTSNGLGWTDIGDADSIGGFAREFYHQIFLHYATSSAWNVESREAYLKRSSLRPDSGKQMMFTFEPKIAAAVFERLLKQTSVTLIKARIQRPGGIRKHGNHLEELRSDDGKIVIKATQFIDASYEGDLLAEVGVSYTVGRESAETYHELLAGIQTAQAKKNQLVSGIDPYQTRGEPGSGLLPGIMAGPGGADGDGDQRFQAYCYRMCLTDVASNRMMIFKPTGYREADFELLFRAVEAGQRQRFCKLSPLPNRKTDSNNDAGFSTDFIGGNYDLLAHWNYAEASYLERDCIDRAHRDFQLGMLWTLQHHPRIPAEIRRAWSRWGLPLDEFTDNDHWPSEIYIREARRMVSDFVLTEHDVHQETGHVAADPVGMGGYNLDSHNVQRYVTAQGFVQNEGDVQVAPARGPYGISYRAIVPRSSEADNLLVPVCLSASHTAFGSVRMEPVFMILGQSAGAAAVLALKDSTPVQKVDYAKLSRALTDAGQILTTAQRRQEK